MSKKILKWSLITISLFISLLIITFVVSRIYMFRGWEVVALEYTQNEITVNGILDEPCWSLKNHEFYLLKGAGVKTSNLPSFQFLQDSINLYLATKYEISSSIPVEKLHDGSLCISLKLRPKENGTKYKFRVAFEPADDEGNVIGKLYCDCPKYERYWDKEITNCKFVSVVKDNLWTVEFSIPLKEIISPDDNELWYRLVFNNSHLPEGLIAFYPFHQDSDKRRYFKIIQHQ